MIRKNRVSIAFHNTKQLKRPEKSTNVALGSVANEEEDINYQSDLDRCLDTFLV